MKLIKMEESAEGALRLVKDDYQLLANKAEVVLINLQVPGSLDAELSEALRCAKFRLEDYNPSPVGDAELKAAVTALVTLAVYTHEVIANSLVPGDMLEETFLVSDICKQVKERWITKK